MHPMLHTLKKDIRRLWSAAAATWLMLAFLARADRWRADNIPSPMEGWLNLILPAAWACLAALAVLEEPLVGDRNFWTTRPHRWPALLAAKLLFVALAVHLPSLLSGIYVLSARGFSPAPYLGDLAWSQLQLFACLILPAIAVASLVRGFTHFVLALFTIAAALAILTGGLYRFPSFSPLTSQFRETVTALLLLAAAIAVILIQYSRRRTAPARAIAAFGAIAALLVATYLPARASYPLSADAALSLRAPGDSAPPAGRGPLKHVMLPVAVEAPSTDARFHAVLLDAELLAPDGTRLQSVRLSRHHPFDKVDFVAGLRSESRDAPPGWLALSFSESAWNRVRNAPVRISGSVAFEHYRQGEPAPLRLDNSLDIPGVGTCAAHPVDDHYSRRMLKIFCESPRPIPAAAILLRHQPSGRTWLGHLNSSFPYYPGPNRIWLSPLHRAQTYFHLTESEPSGPGTQWLVPSEYVHSSDIRITPEIPAGRSLVRFHLVGVNLSTQ